MTISDRPVKLGLLWHSLRSDNLGVGALTISHIELLREAAERAGRRVAFDVLGFGGNSHYPPDAVDVKETIATGFRYLLPGSPLWRAIRASDIILDIGAGDSFTDIYARRRSVWIIGTKYIAIALRKPLVLAPQTIGPFGDGNTRRAAALAVRYAYKSFARDTPSKLLLDELAPGGPNAETVDVAFALPFKRPLRDQGGRIRFGFNVSGLLYAGGYSGTNEFKIRGDYRSTVTRIIEGLLARGDVEVILVPHVITPDEGAEDDLYASREVAARFPKVSIAPRFRSPSEAKSFISGLDVLAGSRMHATIAAVSSGVAAVPLAYSRKFSGLFTAVGYPLVGDCTTQSEDELVNLTLGAVDRRAELAAAAAASNAVAQQKLDIYRDFLTELIRSCPN